MGHPSGAVPFTAFHPVVVWSLWKRAPKLDFVALTVGAVIPDLFELVFVFLLPDLYWVQRDLSHSLLGAVTYDVGLGLAGVLVARRLLHFLDRIHPSPLWSRYGGRDYRTGRPWRWVVLSLMIGSLAHVLVDLPFHWQHPLLFPFGERLVLFPAEQAFLVDRVTIVLFGSLFLYLLYVNWWRPAHARQSEK